MKTATVHLDRLDLTVRGVSPSTVRTALASLGPELAGAINARLNTASATPVPQASIDAGTVRVSSGHDAAELRTALAAHIARAALPSPRPATRKL